MPDFYLASQSPRRRELLSSLGYSFEVIKPLAGTDSVDEEPQEGESSEEYVVRVTRMKAEWGRKEVKKRGLKNLPVLASDTTVSIDGRILGKPRSIEEAAEFLSRLSGRTHQVLTAVALASESRTQSLLSVSEVLFKELSSYEIEKYAQSGEPMDKAGGYGIQGKAGTFVRSITGSFTGIMGLPVYETSELLANAGIPLFPQ